MVCGCASRCPLISKWVGLAFCRGGAPDKGLNHDDGDGDKAFS